MKHRITLGNGRHVTIASYVATIRHAKAHPQATYPHGLTGWWQVQGYEIVEQYMAGVHDRINRHIPGYGKGHRWGEPYQTETKRAAIALNQPRLIIHWLPHWLRTRFAHRLDRYDEAA